VFAAARDHDVLLAAASGKCIRFPVTGVRMFTGRNSTGVRGIRLAGDDKVISMSLLRHVEFGVEERNAYIKRSRAERAERAEVQDENGEAPAVELDDERYAKLTAQDQFILTLAADGYGKRTSAYEYRVSGRGGQGITNIDLTRNGNNTVVASFPVQAGDQLVLVTDKGQLTRTTVEDIRIFGRATQGVIVFRIADDERLVSVTRMGDDAAGGDGANGANGEYGANEAGEANGVGRGDGTGGANGEGEADGG